jgi:beta-lactam-binding protein with PASTA domain
MRYKLAIVLLLAVFGLEMFGVDVSADATEVPPWAVEGANKQAKEAVERAEAEKRAKEEAEHKAAQAKEQEQKAKEASEQQAREAAGRKAREESEHKPRPATVGVCVVPALKGRSLRAARGALQRAHCKLGKVREPRGHHGLLVVVAQSRESGEEVRGTTAINVTLAAKKPKRRAGRHR